MKNIKQTYIINSSVDKVWQALVNPKIIDDWGGGPVKMSEKVGAEFSLWDGEIHGKNVEVIPNKKLVQDWMEGKWDQYSKVTFILSKQGNKTKVELIHEDIPDKEVKGIADGWEKFYLGPLKELLER